ncbi:hypothetical protein EVY09_18840 [Enterobacter cloacae]|nr:hypothetical protein EVY09_18840 [Enterobacter cloacae]
MPNHRLVPVAAAAVRINPERRLLDGATLTGPTNVGRIRRSRHPAKNRTVSNTRQRLSVPIKQRA